MIDKWTAAVLAVVAALGVVFAACQDEADSSHDSLTPDGASTIASPHSSARGTFAEGELTHVSGDQAIPGQIDPCSLVTRDEVAVILGGQVDDPYRHMRPTVLCEYSSDPDQPDFSSATIRVEHLSSPDELTKELEVAAKLGGDKPQTVSDTGDAAYSVGPLLYVQKGSTLLPLAVIVRDAPDLDAAKDIAQLALTRLP